MSRRLLHAVASGALALSGATAGVVAAGAPAQACTIDPVKPERLLKRADDVFVGTVDSRRTVGRRVVYTVDVSSVYAGEITTTPVEVVTARQSSACGVPDVEVGQEWLFVTNGPGSRPRLSQGDGSGPASSAKLRRAEDVLGTPQAIAEPEPERDPLEFTASEAGEPLPLSRLVAPGAAALLVGFLGWVAVRRVGRRARA